LRAPIVPLRQNTAGRSLRATPFLFTIGLADASRTMSRSSSRALLVCAALLVASVAAQAQNAVLYGLIDASGSRSRPPGGDFRWQLDSGNMSRSYLGFRGSEDLGGGLRAVFRLESYVAVDTGRIGRFDGDAFWGRDANVGLSGAFGTTVLGRNVTPLYLTTVNFNPFGDSFGFSPSTRQYFAGAVLGDRSWNNSMAYTNNARDPLRVHLVLNTPEASGPSIGRNSGLSVAYISGPFAVAAAAEKIKNSAFALPTGFERQTALQINVSYDFSFVRLYGQLGRVKTEAMIDSRTVLGQIGAAVPIGNGLILVAYGQSQERTPYSQITDRTTSLGYDYFLSKSTDIYVAALSERTFGFSNGSSIAGGVRIRF
jgi:predicted porin